MLFFAPNSMWVLSPLRITNEKQASTKFLSQSPILAEIMIDKLTLIILISYLIGVIYLEIK